MCSGKQLVQKRPGHILIEINNKVLADEIARKLTTAMKKDIDTLLLANRETLEIKKYRFHRYQVGAD